MKTNVPSNFIWLNITQAIGSFMDNLFKMLTVFYLADALGLPLERTLAISTVLLVVPFIILSNLAGALADRYSKTKLIHIVKWAELALIALSFPAYFSGRAWPMLTVLTLLACQSAFFGPLKRGIIPEIVPSEAIAEANGLLSATSYLGIIAGMVLPSVLCARLDVPYWGYSRWHRPCLPLASSPPTAFPQLHPSVARYGLRGGSSRTPSLSSVPCARAACSSRPH